MSWQHPPPGAAWNQGIAQVTPDMMNVGSFTAEQWAIIQQQNWQQWTQWQQQYAQWQSQYGEKYAQQMQNMMVGGVPPPPPQTAPPAPPAPPVPPAPPPPEKPPPPSENNQPLYNSPHSLAPVPPPTQQLVPPVPPPAKSFPPVPPPTQKPAPVGNVNPKGLDKVNWTNAPKNVWTTSNSQANVSQTEIQVKSSINSEALKKLAEEEKQFDIQFRKWEEEIEKWKRENVNHPDKQAYQEYEAKFEACRAQLLERRQQMKQKRTHLMDGSPQETYRQESHQAEIQISEGQKVVSNKFSDRGSQKSSTIDKPIQNISKVDPNFESGDGHPQKDYESDSYGDDPSKTNSSTFLQTNDELKGIPGLDLVGDSEENRLQHKNSEIIDITDERLLTSKPKTNVDFGALTKGIHNILEDEKIMNMLSIVRGQSSASHQSSEYDRSRDQTYGGTRSEAIFHQNKLSEQTFNPNRQVGQAYNQSRSYDPGFNEDTYYDQDMFRDISFNHKRQNNQSFTQNRSNDPSFKQNRPFNQSLKHNGLDDETLLQNRYNDQSYSQHSKPNDQIRSQGSFGQNRISYDNEQGKTGNRDQWTLSNNQAFSNVQKQEFNPKENYVQPPPLMQLQPIEEYNRSMPHPSQPTMTSKNSSNLNTFSDSNYNKNAEFNKINVYKHNDKYYKHDQNLQENTQELIEQPRGVHEQNITQRINNFQSIPNMPQERSTLQDMTNQQCSTLNVDKNININETMPTLEPKWKDEPILIPSVIVEYEHKPLRLKARDFIEPVQVFDYNHKSKNDEYKNINMDVSENMLFQRKRDMQPRRPDTDDNLRPYGSTYKSNNRENHDRSCWNKEFENYDRMKLSYKDDLANDPYVKDSLRDTRDMRESRDIKDIREPRDRRNDRERYDDRKPYDGKYYERRRIDREKYSRRDDSRDRYKGRYSPETRREERFSPPSRSRSRERDSHKRVYNKDSEIKENNIGQDIMPKDKHLFTTQPMPVQRTTILMIDDLLEPPGRDARPEKLVIILRGPPGSGKSYLAQLIRDREIKHGGNVRIMSIDDYFMQETEVEEKDPITGKMVKKTVMKYEYDAAFEENYLSSLKKAFKRTVMDGFHPFVIFDAVNETLRCYADVWNFGKQNGFQVYVCTMEMDAQTCFKRNIHNRTLSDIEVIITRFFKTPAHHITLDPTTLLQSAAIDDVHMEDVEDEEDVVMEDAQEEEEVTDLFASKWDKMEDADKLERLDGTSKPLRPSHYSMEDYLQLDDWQPTVAKPGKKTVRWADIEERRQQEKMRAVGFVLGQTDWERMTDPTLGSSALTQTKYIERVRRH